MPVPLGQLHSSAGSSVLTTSPSASTACAVTFLVTAPFVSAIPFVPPSDVTPVKPSRKCRCVEDPKSRREC